MGILYYLIFETLFTCDRWYHWLVTVVIVLILAPVVVFCYSDSVMQDMNYDYETQEHNFAIASLGVTFVLYMIVCFSIKGLSLNNSKTPF